MTVQDDSEGTDGKKAPQPPDDEEAAKHLADFSGYVGHTDHDKPGTDEVLGTLSPALLVVDTLA